MKFRVFSANNPVVPEKAQTALEPAIVYRGAGNMKSVIPKKRKLVKRMMYDCIKEWIKSLFRPTPELR
ncbi:hypothetical protein E5676_scaffold481G00190 [Cucumis melo var. makuwa]|uniref:Uncharacterized protein n=2 Tax=Cucumis melo TaxID=3656 RepID=A0A5D3D590_CUCMM|nr:hypothetical protein E5676_scaffold481G00190 [Cucumis melo var. makuwa]